MRFDSASAHLEKDLFSFNLIEYLFHPSSVSHELIEYTSLIDHLNRSILRVKINSFKEDDNDHLYHQ